MHLSLGLVCAVAMPLFNIPMIIRIVQRKSSEDISLLWCFGIWLCILGMIPAGLASIDPVLRAFTVMNAVFFTGVVAVVVYYHPSLRSR
jgi:hypothetical protein